MAEEKQKCSALALNAQLTTDDIVAVRVSELETALAVEEEALRKERQALQKTKEKLLTDFDKALKDFGETVYGKRAEELKVSLGKIYPHQKFISNINVSLNGRFDPEDCEDEENVPEKEKKNVYVRMTIGINCCGSRSEVTLNLSEDTYRFWPTTLRQIRAAQTKNDAEITKNLEKVGRNSLEIKKLPMMERAVKAAIAKKKIEEIGEEGLLEVMRKVNIPAMRALPLIISRKG
jgi:hypothetical protein